MLLRLADAIDSAVREIAQVMIDGCKAASPGGALTPDQGAQAKQAALDRAKAHLGPVGLADVQRTLGLGGDAVDPLRATRIEAAVHRLKTSARVPPDAGTAGGSVPFAA